MCLKAIKATKSQDVVDVVVGRELVVGEASGVRYDLEDVGCKMLE